MNADQAFQLWLTLLSLALAGVGGVLWWFAMRVINMPEKYATKDELRTVADDWKGELNDMRRERREDNEATQRKLDKIDDTVTGIHRRIDMLFDQRQRQ